MNNAQKELLERFILQSDELFHSEIKTEENKDYRRGFYAGRLFASIAIKNALNSNQGLDIMKIEFSE